MADRLSIQVRGLEVFGRHGVYPEETALGQRFVVDMEIVLEGLPGVESDSIQDTLDYSGLTGRVAEIVAGPPCKLLEHLAGRIADAILCEPLAREVTVTVHKPHVSLTHVVADVAVSLSRRRP